MKKTRIIFSVVSVVVLLLLFGGYLFLKMRLPRLSGDISLHGLRGEVSIITDSHGIPHIEAGCRQDLYFAMGYVHARDRLFQMEFLKMIALGRLSEITGESGLGYDRFIRTLGLVRRAEAVKRDLDTEVRSLGESYVRGINAYISENPSRIPVEFLLMKFRPAPWTTTDLLTYAHLLLWGMHYNFNSELLYYALEKKIGARAMDLLPFRPSDAPVLSGGSGQAELICSIPEVGPSGGSNNWVLSGKKTVSGKPILVEDPHGHNPSVPAVFYMVHLKCPGWDVTGLSTPGLPFFQHAYNRHIAYGSTTTGSDMQDLFIEKIHPRDPDRYLFRGKWLGMDIHRETIRIRQGRGFREEEIRIRGTVHGPVISDVMEGVKDTLALKWMACDARIIRAMKMMSEATDCREFIKAGGDYHSACENFLCADTKGTIAYATLGYLPLRGKKTARWFPVPGWNGKYEWTGHAAGSSLPRKINPRSGYLATANNRIRKKGTGLDIDGKFASHYRYARIVELIEEGGRFTAGDAAAMLNDTRSLLAARIVPLYAEMLEKTGHARAGEAAELFAEWDYAMDTDSAAATLYHQVTLEFMTMTLGQRLGKKLTEKYLRQWYCALDRWVLFVEQSNGYWFDDPATPEIEDRQDAFIKAFASAVSRLEDRLGRDMADWKWGRVHQLSFQHQPMTKAGWPLDRIFGMGPWPFGGDMETIHRGSYSTVKPFSVNNASSFRLVVDFSCPDRVLFVQANGQSGSLLSPYRGNFVPYMRSGGLVSIELDMKKVRRKADGILRLRPH